MNTETFVSTLNGYDIVHVDSSHDKYEFRLDGVRKASASTSLLPYVLAGKMEPALRKFSQLLGLKLSEAKELLTICQAHQNLIK